MMNNSLAVIILAAGKGERMKSSLPKVLHQICGRPMINFVIDLVNSLKIDRKILIVGHKQDLVKRTVPADIKIILQKRLLGSADAVKQAKSGLKNFKGPVLVLYGDHPLLLSQTVKKLIKFHLDNKPAATILTATVNNPSGYGRIMRDKYNSIRSVIEEKDADDFVKDIKEINIGCACFDKKILFEALKKIKRNKLKKEFYLTDIFEIFYKQNRRIESVNLFDLKEGLGINSRLDLNQANKIMQERILKQQMDKGVTIVSAETTFIDWGVKIGGDTTIYPFTVIEEDVKIGRHCSIGPFCHLRKGTVIEDNSVIGNFSELVRCRIGKKALAKHFCYLGDVQTGSNVNIGAGSVTANFDGKRKNKTVIKDNAFIGSDSVLIAPVTIGKGSVTGAGSVISKNKNVADYTVVAGVPARFLKKIN